MYQSCTEQSLVVVNDSLLFYKSFEYWIEESFYLKYYFDISDLISPSVIAR